MKLFELFEKDLFGVKTPSPEEVARKHNVPLEVILRQLKMGIRVEQEHTQNEQMAREIALDHLNELPDYYTRLRKMEERQIYENLLFIRKYYMSSKKSFNACKRGIMCETRENYLRWYKNWVNVYKESMNSWIKSKNNLLEHFDIVELDEYIQTYYNDNITTNFNFKQNQKYYFLIIKIDSDLDYDFNGFTIELEKEYNLFNSIIKNKNIVYDKKRVQAESVLVFETEDEIDAAMMALKLFIENHIETDNIPIQVKTEEKS